MKAVVLLASSLVLMLACASGATVVSNADDSVGRGETPRLQCPAAIGPAVRAFEAKCAEKTATRDDLIALKRFIAASAIDGAAKTNWTQQVRRMYQESRRKRK